MPTRPRTIALLITSGALFAYSVLAAPSINPRDIKPGTIDTNEFGALEGVRSNLQAQIDSKFSEADQLTLSNAIISAAAEYTDGATNAAVDLANTNALIYLEGYLPLSGGTMVGNIDMGTFLIDVERLGQLAADGAVGENYSAFGTRAGQNVDGSLWVAFGSDAGQSAAGNAWFAGGAAAGYEADGLGWVGLGSFAGWEASGDYWQALGYGSGWGSTGSQWSAVGRGAGTGAHWSNSIALGPWVGRNAGGTNRVYIDALAGDPGADYNPTSSAVFFDGSVENGELYLGRLDGDVFLRGDVYYEGFELVQSNDLRQATNVLDGIVIARDYMQALSDDATPMLGGNLSGNYKAILNVQHILMSENVNGYGDIALNMRGRRGTNFPTATYPTEPVILSQAYGMTNDVFLLVLNQGFLDDITLFQPTNANLTLWGGEDPSTYSNGVRRASTNAAHGLALAAILSATNEVYDLAAAAWVAADVAATNALGLILTPQIVELQGLTSVWEQAAVDATTWTNSQFAASTAGRLALGDGVDYGDIATSADGGAIIGTIDPAATVFIGPESDGASIYGWITGTVGITNNAEGVMVGGVVGGVVSIGEDCDGVAVQGYLKIGNTITVANAYGTLLLIASGEADAAQTVTVSDGDASIGLGYVTITNDQCLVMGNGMESHGDGSLTAISASFHGGDIDLNGGSLLNVGTNSITYEDGTMLTGIKVNNYDRHVETATRELLYADYRLLILEDRNTRDEYGVISDTYNDETGIDGASSSGYLWSADGYVKNYADLEALGTSDTNLLALYHWDVDGATNWTDSVSGNAATGIGGPTFVAGEIGDYAIYCDGVDDRVELAGTNTLAGAMDFTMALWLKMESPRVNSAPILYHEGASQLGLKHRTSSTGMYVYVNGYGPTTKKTIIPTNEWCHIAVTYTGATEKATVFLNGLPTEGLDYYFAPDPPIVQTNSFHFGVQRDAPYQLKGAADEIAIYDRALSDSEIMALAIPSRHAMDLRGNRVNLPLAPENVTVWAIAEAYDGTLTPQTNISLSVAMDAAGTNFLAFPVSVYATDRDDANRKILNATLDVDGASATNFTYRWQSTTNDRIRVYHSTFLME